MATVKEYIVKNNYQAGDTISGPNGETYIVGKRGRCPLWLMTLAGAASKRSKGLKANKAIVAKVAGKVAKNGSGGSVTLTNGSFIVNGEALYVGEDAEIQVPAGAVICGA